MHDLEFPETSQSLSSFKQLLFYSFQKVGTKGKKSKNCDSPPNSGSSFPNRDPLYESDVRHSTRDLSFYPFMPFYKIYVHKLLSCFVLEHTVFKTF